MLTRIQATVWVTAIRGLVEHVTVVPDTISPDGKSKKSQNEQL